MRNNNRCEYGYPVPCGRDAAYRIDGYPVMSSCELHLPLMAMPEKSISDRYTIRMWARQHPDLAEKFYPGNKFNLKEEGATA